MPTKTLEKFLEEALNNQDIEFKIVVSNNGGKIKFYLISSDEGEKKRVVRFAVKGNKVTKI